MDVILRQLRENPAVFISTVVGVLTCAVAVVAVLAAGGGALGAIAAGLGSLVTSLTGGLVTRARVSPTETE